MIGFRPMVPDDLPRLGTLQEAEAYLGPQLGDAGYAEDLCAVGFAWTGVHGVRVVACGGVVAQTAWRGYAWMLIGAVPRAAWLAILRKSLDVIRRAHVAGLRRIAAEVDLMFAAGHRFALMLGFEPEGITRWVGPFDKPFVSYSRYGP